jgi:DNA (cytosine-5)-methyltransferase 1
MKTVDLFAGCGGLTKGFENADYKIVAAFDNWEPSNHVYRLNFNHPIFEADLFDKKVWRQIDGYKPDLIMGGPPCQDFSSAGKRDEDQGRGDLTITYAQIIDYCRPNFFVMENVDRIIKTQKLQDAIAIFREAGYGVSYAVLDASYRGVPQKRKRFFMVGELGGKDDAITPYLECKLSESSMTIHDYLGDKLGFEHYYRHPRNYNRRGVFSIHEPSPTVRGVNRPVPAGYPGHHNDTASVTKTKVRPLTTVERSYIQTFPESFIFEGTKTNLEQMIGNAVPVKLAEFVAQSIKRYIRGSRKK